MIPECFLTFPGLRCMEPSGKTLSISTYCILWNPERVDGDERQGIFHSMTSGQAPDLSWFRMELAVETNFKGDFQRVTSIFFCLERRLSVGPGSLLGRHNQQFQRCIGVQGPRFVLLTQTCVHPHLPPWRVLLSCHLPGASRPGTSTENWRITTG